MRQWKREARIAWDLDAKTPFGESFASQYFVADALTVPQPSKPKWIWPRKVEPSQMNVYLPGLGCSGWQTSAFGQASAWSKLGGYGGYRRYRHPVSSCCAHWQAQGVIGLGQNGHGLRMEHPAIRVKFTSCCGYYSCTKQYWLPCLAMFAMPGHAFPWHFLQLNMSSVFQTTLSAACGWCTFHTSHCPHKANDADQEEGGDEATNVGKATWTKRSWSSLPTQWWEICRNNSPHLYDPKSSSSSSSSSWLPPIVYTLED